MQSVTTSPALVATFRVKWHSGSAPLAQLGRVTRQGERVVVTPFDAALVPTIVKALVDARQIRRATKRRA
jgi:ribosome recycling factor